MVISERGSASDGSQSAGRTEAHDRFVEAVRYALDEKGWDQKDLAAAASLSPATVSRYLKRAPTEWSKVERLLVAAGADVDTFGHRFGHYWAEPLPGTAVSHPQVLADDSGPAQPIPEPRADKAPTADVLVEPRKPPFSSPGPPSVPPQMPPEQEHGSGSSPQVVVRYGPAPITPDRLDEHGQRHFNYPHLLDGTIPPAAPPHPVQTAGANGRGLLAGRQRLAAAMLAGVAVVGVLLVAVVVANGGSERQPAQRTVPAPVSPGFSATSSSSVAPVLPAIVRGGGAAGVALRLEPSPGDEASIRGRVGDGSALRILCGQQGTRVSTGGPSARWSSTWLKTTDGLYVTVLFVEVPGQTTIPNCTANQPALSLIPNVGQNAPPR